MENNVENKIKEEFRNREIQPSVSAWIRLESKMAVVETTKEKNKFRFIAYAAVFVGLLVSVVFFLKQNKTSDKGNLVTKTSKNKKTEEISVKKNKEKENSEIKQENALVKRTQKYLIKKERPIQIAINKSKKVTTTNNKVVKQNTIPVKVKQVKNIENGMAEKIITHNTLKNSPIKNQLKTQKPKRKLMISTDEDINKLLASAVSKKMKIKTNREVAIQQEYVLYKIEKENHKKFRNKLLDKIKNGVHAVKSYVANNN